MKKRDANRWSAWWALVLVLGCLWACAAIPAGSQWEIRAACMTSAQYGGFYSPEDAAGGGLDYSQQDNPQLTLTDIACANATSTTLTSATGGFDLTHKGNGLYLSGGTNITAGWYCIKTYVDTNTVTVDRAANADGLDGTGGTARVAGAVAAKSASLNAVVAGNTVHVQADATHTMGASIAMTTAGTSALPIKITGYKTVHGDAPTGTERPLIAGGASYNFTFPANVHLSNLRFSSTTATSMYTGTTCVLDNYLLSNLRTSASIGLYFGAGSTANRSEVYGTVENCTAVILDGTDVRWCGGYVHDSKVGFQSSSNSSTIYFSVVDTCTTGVSLNNSASDYPIIVSSTFYNCTTAISMVSGVTNALFLTNVISDCTTGITAANSSLGCVWEDYNNIYDCTTDRTNVPTGAHSYDLDPGFVDAANGDFRVGTNCKAKGFPGAIPGAAVTCIGYLDTGAVQRIEPTGGGGTRATGEMW